ncbi:hypothetical protein AVEN_191974-1 [Araneus ventricosus]|uniref:Uncharacterized protein n=1 Tax=Araneus ventricosus TaxID=182803 RepID=A0A4Y2QSH4_ARAVE|nr:hypothetical protein AVEN_191974-1 [Araneus ventricosus]
MPKSDENRRVAVDMFGFSIRSRFLLGALGQKTEMRSWSLSQKRKPQNGGVELSRESWVEEAQARWLDCKVLYLGPKGFQVRNTIRPKILVQAQSEL